MNQQSTNKFTEAIMGVEKPVFHFAPSSSKKKNGGQSKNPGEINFYEY